MKTYRNLIALVGAMLLLTSATTQAQYHLIHNFASGFSDGASPVESFTLSGTTLYGMTLVGASNTVGMLFKINTDGSNYTILTNGIGNALIGSLQVSGTNIYGVTGFINPGGTTLFRMNTDGTSFTPLFTFGFSAAPVDTLTLSGSAFYGMGNDDTIFTINTDGTGYFILHTFGIIVQEGNGPVGSPVVSGSTIYGLCQSGGENGRGTVFKINTNGDLYSTLYNFSSTDGHPVGSLILSGSTLFGLTQSPVGGFNLFRINPDGTGFTVLGTFEIDGSLTGDLTLQGTTLYGMTSGGTTDTVFAITTSGSGFTVLHSFTGAPSDGDTPVGSPVLSGSALFGLTAGGGSSSFGTVFTLPISSVTTSNGVPITCLPTTQPAQHPFDITRDARYWFTHGYTNDPACASATLEEAIAANGGTLSVGFLCLPTAIRTSGNTAGALDAFIEALGFYYKGTGKTGDTGPASKLCKARKKMVPELIAAIANNVLLGTDPANATYNNGGVVTSFPADLIDQAGQAAAGSDVVEIRLWTTLLRQFNSSGVTSNFTGGLVECTPNTRKFLRSIAKDPTTQLNCGGINDNCAAATTIVFPHTGSPFGPARFRDSAITPKLPSGEAFWKITPDVGVANRRFTANTSGSNFSPVLTILTGTCGLVSSNGVAVVETNSLTQVATTGNSTNALPAKLSFVTDGLSTFFIQVGGGAGKIKLTVTSP